MKNESKPRVIVLSRNYSTGLGVIRSLGRAGYTVDLIASTKKRGSSIIASSSKYVNYCEEVLSPDIQLDDGSGLLEALNRYAETNKEKLVLFPADDFTASVVFSNRSILKEHFFMPGIIDENVADSCDIMNKVVQSDFARRAGFFIPKEWKISLEGEVRIPEEMVYPCFVKPLQSISGSKSEMKTCYSEEELKQHLLEMKKVLANRELLVQEYLKIDKEYDLSGVCLEQKVIVPGILEKYKISKHENGVTMVGKMIPVETLEHVRDRIEALMSEFHYVGMFDMELFLCGEKLYFNEINFRSGGPNYSYYLSGVNLPEIFVEEISGNGKCLEVAPIKNFEKTFLYEKVAWEDYIYSHMSKVELKQWLKSVDYTLLADPEDPLPGKIFNQRIRLSAIKQRLKRVLKR